MNNYSFIYWKTSVSASRCILHTTYSRVGRGSLVLRHFASHRQILVVLRYCIKYFIFSTGNRTHNLSRLQLKIYRKLQRLIHFNAFRKRKLPFHKFLTKPLSLHLVPLFDQARTYRTQMFV